MKNNVAKDFWNKIIKLLSAGGGDVVVSNPAIDTVVRAYCGEYDSLEDKAYTQKLKDVGELSAFWGNDTETAANLFMKALAMTDISDQEISRIAGILAQASSRTEYKTEKSNEKEGNVDTPDQPFTPDSKCVDWTKPRAIYDYLDQHIYGQEAAKRAVSMLVYNHLRGNSRNIVMAGSTGCGKTEIWRSLSRKLPCIRIINGPQLSCDGWKGSLKISDILTSEPKQTAEHLILVIDEADKMLKPAVADGGTDVAKMIQSELLKLMDGDTLMFADEKNRNVKFRIDCSGISVVLCGSFEHMLQAKSEASGSIGFGQSERRDSRISECTEEDLVKYANMRREIAGRISRIVTLDTLHAEDFEAILQSPASPIQKIEKCHNVKIILDAPTRRKLAEEAEKSKMGCRYIRSRLQNMLDEQMFDFPEAGEYELCCP